MSLSPKFGNATATSEYIKMLVKEDDAGKYDCGQGVRFTLESLGIPHVPRSESGPQHGYKWVEMLRSDKMQEAGWQEVDIVKEGWTPQNCPPGVVWVYDHDQPRGNNGKGSQYGHVEISLEKGKGFASGGVFNNPGGSVRGNPKTAFIHPDLMAIMGGGPVTETYARETLERANDRVAARKREFVSETHESRVAVEGYDLDQVDLSNMNGAQLFQMLMCMFFGIPLSREFPVLESAAAGDNAKPAPSDPALLGHPAAR